ncbi:LysM peptidoglycan-binding domain-containing protein [Calidifontibacter indicus]|uniref:LysM domain-containing protein n=1 Tax=Calidifontibacter indicus TaxID=419650 RepID=A0A3D9UQD5_9MICO|nr:LysM peptidoglycan-binding domain-containing protein [Calidifontibacter indicus]REF31539.1 hypothetical protein DFJ65_2608 [Calidifontibacter indicus]
MSAVAHWDAPVVGREPRTRRHLHLVPAQSQVSAAGEGAVRLTIRGRRLVAALVLAAIVGGGWGVGQAFAGGSSSSELVVRSGQTLSEVAHAAYPQLPVGEAVYRIQRANGLNSLQVSEGQRLVVPR